MEILRDPLWNNIRLDPLALALLETPVMQRLRYVRQLGLAFLVYPGATHSRFEHALGAWHLAGVALRLLEERGALAGISPRDQQVVRAAALLHDVGHYPFSHALEEIGVTDHEEVARPLIVNGAIGTVLRDALGDSAPGIRCRDSSPAPSTSTRSSTSSATPRCAACPTARSMSTGC